MHLKPVNKNGRNYCPIKILSNSLFQAYGLAIHINEYLFSDAIKHVR